MVSEEKIISPYEIANVLHCSLRLVYRQLRLNVIPHVKLGDRYIVGRKSFFAWLDSGCQLQSK